jgi:GNAT superfamily N-acetyltransferase
MNFSVRRARPEDAESACVAVRRSIEQCCVEDHQGDPERIAIWLHNKTPENFLAWIQGEKQICVVAEESSSVVGFGMSSTDEVLLCYVVPEALHRGVGRAVLGSLERLAAASGASALRLESTRTAMAFYGRNGFESCGPPVVFAGMEGYPLSKRLMASPFIERAPSSLPCELPAAAQVKR